MNACVWILWAMNVRVRTDIIESIIESLPISCERKNWYYRVTKRGDIYSLNLHWSENKILFINWQIYLLRNSSIRRELVINSIRWVKAERIKLKRVTRQVLLNDHPKLLVILFNLSIRYWTAVCKLISLYVHIPYAFYSVLIVYEVSMNYKVNYNLLFSLAKLSIPHTNRYTCGHKFHSF